MHVIRRKLNSLKRIIGYQKRKFKYEVDKDVFFIPFYDRTSKFDKFLIDIDNNENLKNSYIYLGVISKKKHKKMNDRYNMSVFEKKSKLYFKAYARSKYIIVDRKLPRFFKLRKNQVIINIGKKKIKNNIFKNNKIYNVRFKTQNKLINDIINIYQIENAKHKNSMSYQYFDNKFNFTEKKMSFSGIFKKHGFFLNDNEKIIYSYKNKFKDEKCYLIGNGPSLKAEDLDMLTKEYTFGCNHINKIFDQTNWRPNFYFLADILVAEEVFNSIDMKEVKSELFLLNSVNSKFQIKKELLNETVITNYKSVPLRSEYKFQPNPLAYHTPGGTVMSFMLSLAMFMGFKEIHLIGVDCTSSLSMNGHFSGNYFDVKTINNDIKRVSKRLKKSSMTAEEVAEYYYKRVLITYAKIKNYADKKKIKIYNSTRGGVLEIFERMNLEESLNEKKNSCNNSNKIK